MAELPNYGMRVTYDPEKRRLTLTKQTELETFTHTLFADGSHKTTRYPFRRDEVALVVIPHPAEPENMSLTEEEVGVIMGELSSLGEAEHRRIREHLLSIIPEEQD